MKRMLLPVLLIFVVPAAPAGAQTTEPVMQSVRPYYDRVKDLLLRATEQMPEEDLAFQPTPEVRSGLAMLGHIADAQHFFCSAALGESAPHQTQIERTITSKGEMVQALRESFAYCDQAYAQSDAQALEPLRAFGGDRTRLSQLVLNVAHNWEHYGNIVTYMRMRGQVPPSSQPSQ